MKATGYVGGTCEKCGKTFKNKSMHKCDQCGGWITQVYINLKAKKKFCAHEKPPVYKIACGMQGECPKAPLTKGEKTLVGAVGTFAGLASSTVIYTQLIQTVCCI